MAVQKQDGLHTDVGESGADLRGKEDYLCRRDSTGKIVLCGAGEVIGGVISEGRDVGYHTSFNTPGNPILRVIAGEAIAADVEVCAGAGGKLVAGATNAIGRTRKAVSGVDVIAEVTTYPTT